MARFKYTNNSQGMIITVNLKEQLLPDTLEWTINYLIVKTDMSLFDENYHNDKKGAAAYSPGILLKAILYCYSRGNILLKIKKPTDWLSEVKIAFIIFILFHIS